MYPIRLFLKHLPNAIFLGLSFLINLFAWGWLLLYIRPQEAPIFLHYNVLFGVDLTGMWYEVFFLPLAGFLIIVTNSLLAWILYKKDRFAGYVLLCTAAFCQILIAIVSGLLVFLNV